MKSLSIGSGGLYVESGVTGNIIYCGRGGEENTVPAIWQKAYPNLLIPKIHMWVIFNNRFQPLPGVTPPNWPAVIQRSLETSTRAATATAERHLFAIAEISRLKRKPRHTSVWTLFGSAHEGQLAKEWKGRLRFFPLPLLFGSRYTRSARCAEFSKSGLMGFFHRVGICY